MRLLCRKGNAPFDERYQLVGLLDMLDAVRVKKPAAIAAEDDCQSIDAPVSGRVVPLSQVGDPVFSQGMLGRGLGIEPTGEIAFAPVSGTVAADVKSRHALLFRAESGAEVLLHVGVDSVTLRGRGFRLFVGKGDRVRAGDPVMSFDRELMAQSGIDGTVIVTVTNSDDFSKVSSVCGEEVSAGSAVLRVER